MFIYLSFKYCPCPGRGLSYSGSSVARGPRTGPRPPAELKERSVSDRYRCGARAPFLNSNLATVRCHGRPSGRPKDKKKPGNDLLSHSAARAVPSARAGLTSVFGMGTGVSPPLWSPGFVTYFMKSGTDTPQNVRFFV